MIYNAEDDSPAEFSGYDLCIIGSGPAGIAVGSELSDTSLRICILESGGETKSAFADALRMVESEGIEIDGNSRERIFGGSSETWAGLCVPLDPIDFVRRPFPHHLGWPFSKAELDPWYERAAARFNLPSPGLFAKGGFPGEEKASPRFSWENCEEKIFLKPHPIFRFGLEFKRHCQNSEKIDVVINATVTRLGPDASSGKIRADIAVCKTAGGKEVRIRAKAFVLAAGAIDNARILLNSTGISSHGLGNEHDQVGRYLMNHPKGGAGLVFLDKPIGKLRHHTWRPYGHGVGFVGVRLREEVQARWGALNCYVQIAAHFPWTAREETVAFRTFLGELKTLLHHLLKGRLFPMARWQALLRAGRRAGHCFPGLCRLILLRLAQGWHPSARAVRFFNHMEMEPNPENRVTLGKGRDALGVPLPHVRHVRSERDVRSLLVLHKFLAQEFVGLGMGGRLASSPMDIESKVVLDAYHYLGTTRMGNDPKTSVVDSNLRVHSVENLYVAGGSVFPTSGCANPTLTIVALSMRLADHLRGGLVRPSPA